MVLVALQPGADGARVDLIEIGNLLEGIASGIQQHIVHALGAPPEGAAGWQAQTFVILSGECDRIQGGKDLPIQIRSCSVGCHPARTFDTLLR